MGHGRWSSRPASGYGAALLARCGARVTALEEDSGLVARARTTLGVLAPGVSVVTGPLAEGWKAGAPYDLVLIEGAVAAIPPAIADQVRADPGRLVAVRRQPGEAGSGVLGEQTPFGMVLQPIFECGTPMLQSLVAKPVFTF